MGRKMLERHHTEAARRGLRPPLYDDPRAEELEGMDVYQYLDSITLKSQEAAGDGPGGEEDGEPGSGRIEWVGPGGHLLETTPAEAAEYIVSSLDSYLREREVRLEGLFRTADAKPLILPHQLCVRPEDLCRADEAKPQTPNT